MIALHLYWKRDGEDINLGCGWHEVVPPVGGLVSHGTPHGGVWRVVTHLQYLIEEGSQAHRQWRDWHRHTDDPQVTLFVEPAEGPFEA